eukprot:gene980-1065_t
MKGVKYCKGCGFEGTGSTRQTLGLLPSPFLATLHFATRGVRAAHLTICNLVEMTVLHRTAGSSQKVAKIAMLISNCVLTPAIA